MVIYYTTLVAQLTLWIYEYEMRNMLVFCIAKEIHMNDIVELPLTKLQPAQEPIDTDVIIVINGVC